MQFRVLGSLEIWEGGNQLEISGAKRRALLAVLVLHANEVVGRDRLVDELWGERAPRNAAASLHNHVSRLRKVLGADILVTRAWGYVLRVDPEQLDLHHFKRLVADAEPLPARERSSKLAEALALWRGPALADLVFEPALAKDVAQLEELRLAVLEARIDADLEIGRGAELIGELEALIAEHPLRERMRGQLILALYRDGRQAEALEVYRETRRLLADELGLEPGPALRELERAILRQDPSLAGTTLPARGSDELSLPRRRWLVYGALAGILALAAAGLAAFAATRHRGPGAQPAAAAAAMPWEIPILPGFRPSEEARRPANHSKPATPTDHAKKRLAAAKPKPALKLRSSSARTTEPRPATTKRPKRNVIDSSPKTKRRTPLPKPVRIVDDFALDSINPRLWDWGTLGTGVDVAQRNGYLEMTMHGNATADPHWNALMGYYETSCTFLGDFDARIDYTLVNWPAASGAVVGLSVSFRGDNVHLVRTSRASGQEDYSFWAPTGEARNLLTTDLNGGFRMTRVGGLLTAYFRAGRRWQLFESAHHPGAVSLQPTLWASGSDFAHKDVAVAFDNFSVTVPRSPCP